MNEQTQQKIEEGVARLDKENFRYTLSKSSPHFKVSIAAELVGILAKQCIEEEDFNEQLLKLASFSILWYEVKNG